MYPWYLRKTDDSFYTANIDEDDYIPSPEKSIIILKGQWKVGLYNYYIDTTSDGINLKKITALATLRKYTNRNNNENKTGSS